MTNKSNPQSSIVLLSTNLPQIRQYFNYHFDFFFSFEFRHLEIVFSMRKFHQIEESCTSTRINIQFDDLFNRKSILNSKLMTTTKTNQSSKSSPLDSHSKLHFHLCRVNKFFQIFTLYNGHMKFKAIEEIKIKLIDKLSIVIISLIKGETISTNEIFNNFFYSNGIYIRL